MSLSREQYGYAAAAIVATAMAGYAVYSYMSPSSSSSPPQSEPQPKLPTPVAFKDEGKEELRTLYKTDANKRGKMITDVSYRIALALIRGGKNFHGQVQVKFTLTKLEDTFLDYTGESLCIMISTITI